MVRTRFQKAKILNEIPLKFRLGGDKKVAEKTEEEEFDELFKEFDFAVAACNIGIDESHMYNSEDDNEDVPTNCPILQDKLCSKGKHYLILDEEIGVICKFCSYVKLEIKYVMSEFHKNLFGREDRRRYHEDNLANNRFQFPDSGYDHDDHSMCFDDDTKGTVWDLIPGVKRTPARRI